MHKTWISRQDDAAINNKIVVDLISHHALHPVTARILAGRGIDSETAQSFLSPSYEEHIHSPFLFSRMQDAVDRIFLAIQNTERITVHGDYDADGVTGSAVLISVLRELKAHVDYYIPHRDTEGYGLNSNSVQILANRKTNLIITVDCGIACVDEIALATSLGMDTIVVDHHEFGDILPNAILIHPRLPNETYPFPFLAAVGVSFKLACALMIQARKNGISFSDGCEKWLLDLVSIATVTDMVPMIGENRVLETYGLKVLNKTRRPGLLALIKSAGCVLGALDTESIGFGIGPRINAAGRMDHAEIALKLLLSENENEAAIYCEQIERCNVQRQKTVADMMVSAHEQMKSHSDTKVVALYSADWSPSLVGLVAGKIMERTGKPCIAIGKCEEKWIGSGRSFAEYDITSAIKRAGEGILLRSGGHVQACGFCFTDSDRMQELLQKLYADAEKNILKKSSGPILPIDAVVEAKEINWDLVDQCEKLQPYGEGHRKPIFAVYDLTLQDCLLMGKTKKHIRITFRSPDGGMLKCVGFSMADRFEDLQKPARYDVAFELGVNEWNGRRDIQCKLVDIRASH